MKSLSILATAAAIAGLASACSVKSETVERPAPARTTVTTAPAPGTVVYTDPAPSTTTVYTTR